MTHQKLNVTFLFKNYRSLDNMYFIYLYTSISEGIPLMFYCIKRKVVVVL